MTMKASHYTLKSVVVALGVALCAPAQAGPLVDLASEAEELIENGEATKAITILEQAVELAWSESPLTVRKALFVEGSSGYGLYVERENGNVFRKGDALLIYAEPIGFGYGRSGVGSQSIGFDIEITLREADGTPIVENGRFGHVEVPTRYRNKEFHIDLTMNLPEFPPGDYSVTFTLQDRNSDKSAQFELPFTIVE